MSKSLANRIESLIREPNYQTLNKNELARKLGLAPNERAELRDTLRQLEKRGAIARRKGGRYALRPEKDKAAAILATGTIRFRRYDDKLRAHFVPDEDSPLPDSKSGDSRGDRIKVFARYTGHALDRDRVKVRLVKESPPDRQGRPGKGGQGRGKRAPRQHSSGRLEARVTEILERRNTHFVGVFQKNGKFATVRTDDPSLPRPIDLVEILPKAKPGQQVVAEFVDWGASQRHPRARMVEVLGAPGEPGVDIMSVIRKYQLPLEFPPAVKAEAEQISEKIPLAEIEKREDWRDREVFTIDPSDAKDFDDAIHVRRLDDDPRHGKAAGGWELAVHIADVSHYVKPGTAMDKEAISRGNSVYLADRVVPMLPEKLSNGICSLRPNEDRLTQAVVIAFNVNGKAVSERFISAVIHSKRRFTYEEAFERMSLSEREVKALPREEVSIGLHLHEAWRLAEQLRKRRFQQGALDLDFAEVKVVLDENGRARDIVKIEYDASHQLVEEFMLAANEAVAKTTKDRMVPSLYRIHEDADPEKLIEFRDLARAYGYQAGDLTNRDLLQNLIRSFKGKPEEHTLKIALLKSLKRAAYSTKSVGHYGLSKRNYTHFTSPIRRYADLVVHRVLRRLGERGKQKGDKGKVDGKTQAPDQTRMEEIAKHISETERIAQAAEQETQRLKLIEYMLWVSREKPSKAFEAVVYDVQPIGIFVELTGLQIKGLVRKDDLPRGQRYFVDTARKEISCSQSDFSIKAGDTIQVRLHDIDHERQFINFELAG